MEQSKRPHSSPNHKLTAELANLNLRNERNLGARRIQTELIRLHSCSLSLASIHKALTTWQAQPIKNLSVKRNLSVTVVLFLVTASKWILARLHLEFTNIQL